MEPQPKPKKTVRKSKHITNPPVPEGSMCWACFGNRNLETHGIFGGPYRNASIKYGLQVCVCNGCHGEITRGKHVKVARDALKEYGQEKFEQTHTREEFISTFGRSYL